MKPQYRPHHAPKVPSQEPNCDLELLQELVGPTGAWRSWSSQPGAHCHCRRQKNTARAEPPAARLHHHDPGLAQALGAFIRQPSFTSHTRLKTAAIAAWMMQVPEAKEGH